MHTPRFYGSIRCRGWGKVDCPPYLRGDVISPPCAAFWGESLTEPVGMWAELMGEAQGVIT